MLPDLCYFPRGAFSPPPTEPSTSRLCSWPKFSPDDVYGRVQDKVFLYLAAGVQVVWVVDPVARNVTIFRSDAVPELVDLHEGLEIDLVAMSARLDA